MTEQQPVVCKLKWKRYKFLSEADQRRLMQALQTMRMSCDDAYLVDDEVKAGRKRGEVITLLGEMLERPGMKVVLFSQWLKMHELISTDLTEAGIGHVFFHGGVPGPQRKGLVDRFRDDPECRVFLATDAGGVGLNLQHASAVVNVDLPWNPAVLEQRIGRVHRMGQKDAVQVVNFVARGTIEEGMLGVLKFKSSLSKGVLDGGEKEIFLGGTRLTKFMETVERATGAIPPPPPREEPQAAEEPAPATVPAAADPWASLMQAGAALLGQAGGMRAFVRRDEATGEEYLRLPVPPAGFVEQALGLMRSLVEGLAKR